MFSFSTGTAPGEGVGSRTLYGIAFGPLTVPEAEQQTDHSRNKGGDHARNQIDGTDARMRLHVRRRILDIPLFGTYRNDVLRPAERRSGTRR